MMFQLGDRALDKNGRIFDIKEVVDKDFGSGPVSYFVLTPTFPYDFSNNYSCFVPVEKSENILRRPLSQREILSLIDEMPDLEIYPDVNPRERKVYFTKIIQSGNREDICRVIKTLVFYRERRLAGNKSLSDYDKRMLESLVNLFECEISIVMNMPLNQVAPFIKDRVGVSL